MNISPFYNHILRTFKLNDGNNSAKITGFETGAEPPSFPHRADVLSQLAERPEFAAYKEGNVFHGDTNTAIAASNEMAGKMDDILNRLNEKSQKHLIDSRLMTEETFLELATELDDKELIQLSKALQGIDTPSSLSFISGTKATQNKLIDVLSMANSETRTNIIEQTAQYSEKINPVERNDLYTVRGQLERNTTSNDLHNFVSSLAQTNDVNQFLDKLNSFDEQQQSKLLNVLSLDYELGDRLLDSLADKEKDAQRSILNFVGDVAATARLGNSKAADQENPDGVIPGFDNHQTDISKGMIEDTILILENNDLSGEQLLQMGTELNDMDRTNQRAYLAITKIGLEELIGQDITNTTSNNLEKAMARISALRANEETRMNVFLARYGEPTELDSGPNTKFLQYKTKSQADSDMKTEVMNLIYK